MNAYAPAAATPPQHLPVRARLQPHLTGVYTGPYETVEFQCGDQQAAYCVLPREAAYDLVSRLEDTPPTLATVDRRTAGHVRVVLDDDYRGGATDTPSNWTTDLIMLIKGAQEEDRRRLGRAFPAYAVAVAIATGPGGIETLRRWHETLPDPDPDPDAPGPSSGCADVVAPDTSLDG